MLTATVSGNIGKDAELVQTQGGHTVCRFSVAHQERKDEPPVWVGCSLFGKRGTTLAQYLTKGARVTVVGKLALREKDGRTYLNLDAWDVALQGGGQQTQQRRPAPQQDDFGDFGGDDDVPF